MKLISYEDYMNNGVNEKLAKEYSEILDNAMVNNEEPKFPENEFIVCYNKPVYVHLYDKNADVFAVTEYGLHLPCKNTIDYPVPVHVAGDIIAAHYAAPIPDSSGNWNIEGLSVFLFKIKAVQTLCVPAAVNPKQQFDESIALVLDIIDNMGPYDKCKEENGISVDQFYINTYSPKVGGAG